jgi:hypothetical protein
LAVDFDASQIAAAFAVITKDAKADKVVAIGHDVKVTDGAANVNSIRKLRYA